MDLAKRKSLRRIRTAFHKYTECVYVSGMDNLTREDLEDTYTANKSMHLPTYDEMKEQIFTKLIEEKFRFAICSPSKANCAVRIYRKEVDVDGKPGGVCGAVCFVKNMLGEWTTINHDGKEEKMTFDDTYVVDYWTSVITKYSTPVRASYYDVYLKVFRF